MLTGENGIIKQAIQAKENSREAAAREKLELTLLNSYNEKNLNGEYNENEFLDGMITKEIKGAEVKGDIAIVDGYAYELDRSVPKIGRYLGKAKSLVFPEIEVTVELAENRKVATIKITAIEEKNGINKIEIWQAGEMLDEFKYDNIKEEIEKEYTAKQNGKYTIKVYADLWTGQTAEVEGLVSSVKFEPNGNEEWKEEHSTKITIQETEDKVIDAKYQWTNSVIEPADEIFTESFKSGDTITKNEITGTHYLWIMIETQSGKKVKWRSEGFNFDNEGPNITEFTATKYSETGITLSATAQDTGSGTLKFEFYVDNVLKDTQTCTSTKSSITKSSTITGLTTGSHTCKVIVYDTRNNSSSKTTSGSTKLYAWRKWNCTSKKQYEYETNGSEVWTIKCSIEDDCAYKKMSFNTETGVFTVSVHGSKDSYRNASGLIGNYLIRNVLPYYANSDSSQTGTICYKIDSIDWSKSKKHSTYDYYENVVATMIRYVSVEKSIYFKGSIDYGIVTSTSSTEYKSGERNSDGFWYERINSQ